MTLVKHYVGTRLTSGCIVSVVEHRLARDLNPRLDIRNHSPTGFEWGYVGSGPSQLALALCVDALVGDIERAGRVYHAFKFLVVSSLPREKWSLTVDDVCKTIAVIEEAQIERAARPAGARPF